MKKRDRSDRKQLNFAVDDDVLMAIDEIRALTRPVPTISGAIRRAIFRERDALKRLAKQD